MMARTMNMSFAAVAITNFEYTGSGILNTRHTPRVKLILNLYIRRPINSISYARPVKTINVSRYGALIVSRYAIEQGAELEISNVNRTFTAKAMVVHVTKCEETGDYMIGLNFVEKAGQWVIN